VVDGDNGRVRVVSAKTGRIETIAGNGTLSAAGEGAFRTEVRLSSPRAVAVDRAGAVYVADSGNGRLRKVDPVDGVVLTIAGGPSDHHGGFGDEFLSSTHVGLAGPAGIAVDGLGHVYVADTDAHRLLRLDASTGALETLVGGRRRLGASKGDGGPAKLATVHAPCGLALAAGGDLLVAGLFEAKVRRIEAATQNISTAVGTGLRDDFGRGTFSGDGGAAATAGIDRPMGIAVGASGDIFIADTGNHRIRRVDARTGEISTVAGGGDPDGEGGDAGDGGPATAAQLRGPRGVAVDAAGHVFIADTGNHRVRRVDAATGLISTIAGTGRAGFSGDGGEATAAELDAPSGVAVAPDGTLYIADAHNHRVRVVSGGAPAAAPTAFAVAQRTADLLTRRLAVLSREGEMRLVLRGTDLVSAALDEMRSREGRRQRDGAVCLRLLLSPWARALVADDRYADPTRLFRVPRDVVRPRRHPEAARVRRAALARFTEALEEGQSAAEDDHPMWALHELLVEVGDDETTRALAALLDHPTLARYQGLIMDTAAAIHGFPESWGGGLGICGNSTEEEIARLVKEDEERVRANVRRFRPWHARFLASSPAERAAAVLEAWWGRLAGSVAQAYNLSRELGGLIRGGDAVVPALERVVATTTDRNVRANGHIVLAAIRGHADFDVVTALLDGDDEEAAIGIAMIAATGSRVWSSHLEQVLARDEAVRQDAAVALAATHRRNALPVLQRAAGAPTYARQALEAGLAHAEW
jgi:sugar lactone lactonase YvrE